MTNLKNGFGSSVDHRAMSESDVIRWATEWHDNGLASWDILSHMGVLSLVFLPMVIIYWHWARLLYSSAFRAYVRSGENGMPIFGFAVGFFMLTAIANDVFYAFLFSSPAWAAFYHYAGPEAVIDLENKMYMVSALSILFGAWS